MLFSQKRKAYHILVSFQALCSVNVIDEGCYCTLCIVYEIFILNCDSIRGYINISDHSDGLSDDFQLLNEKVLKHEHGY